MLDEGHKKLIAKALGTGLGRDRSPGGDPAAGRAALFDGIPSPGVGEALKTKVSRDLKAKITLTAFDNRVFIRLSAHAYNSPQDYKSLAERLPALL